MALRYVLLKFCTPLIRENLPNSKLMLKYMKKNLYMLVHDKQQKNKQCCRQQYNRKLKNESTCQIQYNSWINEI
jgi:hypothetical protein